MCSAYRQACAATTVATLIVAFLVHPHTTVLAQTLTSIAGSHSASGWSGDGLATLALLSYPSGIALRPNGDLILADTYNHRVRTILALTGLIVTIAGGNVGFSGDGGDAADALLSSPGDVALNSAGDIFVADARNHRIRLIASTSGLISTFAGGFVEGPGFLGDGRAATLAVMNQPWGVTVTLSGDVFIADMQNHVIRKVAATSGIITTVAGLPAYSGFAGDFGLATSARLFNPIAVAFSEATGALFIADSSNSLVRVVSAAGFITTYAGSRAGYQGDLGLATAAQLNNPTGVTLDAEGRLLVADSWNCAVRMVDAVGVIHTVAGNGTCGFSDGGATSVAMLGNATRLALTPDGGFYIVDRTLNMIRKFSSPSPPPGMAPPSSPGPPAPSPASVVFALPPPDLAIFPPPRDQPQPLVLDPAVSLQRSDTSGRPTGAIVGGVVGGVTALAALLTLSVWVWRKRPLAGACCANSTHATKAKSRLSATTVTNASYNNSQVNVSGGSPDLKIALSGALSPEAVGPHSSLLVSVPGQVDTRALLCNSAAAARAEEDESPLAEGDKSSAGVSSQGLAPPTPQQRSTSPRAVALVLPDITIPSLTSSWGVSVRVGVSAALSPGECAWTQLNVPAAPPSAAGSWDLSAPLVLPSLQHLHGQAQAAQGKTPQTGPPGEGRQEGGRVSPPLPAPLQTSWSTSLPSSWDAACAGGPAVSPALGQRLPLRSPRAGTLWRDGSLERAPQAPQQSGEPHLLRHAAATRPAGSPCEGPDASSELLARIQGRGSVDDHSSGASPWLPPRAVKMHVGGVHWTQGALVDRGGAGKVYVGHDHSGALIAIKVQPLPAGADHFAQELLLSELSALQKLKHNNVVEYLGSAMDEHQLYIFMAYEPQSLAKVLTDGLEEEVVRKYTRQILLGLQYVHSQGIYHRDVKAANVLVSSDGVVKLTDFGSAKMRQSSDHGSSIHIQSIAGLLLCTLSYPLIPFCLGTPHWMSPEICLAAMGQGAGYSGAKADVWSLGVTVVEMMMGGHPWSRMQGLEAIWKVVNSPEGLPRPPLASPMALDFINLCLQRDAVKRGTIAQLLAHPFAAVACDAQNGIVRRAPKASQSGPLVCPTHSLASSLLLALPASPTAPGTSSPRLRVPARTVSAAAALHATLSAGPGLTWAGTLPPANASISFLPSPLAPLPPAEASCAQAVMLGAANSASGISLDARHHGDAASSACVLAMQSTAPAHSILSHHPSATASGGRATARSSRWK